MCGVIQRVIVALCISRFPAGDPPREGQKCRSKASLISLKLLIARMLKGLEPGTSHLGSLFTRVQLIVKEQGSLLDAEDVYTLYGCRLKVVISELIYTHARTHRHTHG